MATSSLFSRYILLPASPGQHDLLTGIAPMQLDFVSPRGGFSGTAPTNAPGPQQYLNNKTDRYHTIFFYCSFSRDGKRGVMGIFPSWVPPGSNGGRKQGHILVLHPYSRNVVATTKGMEKRLVDKLAERDHDVQRFTSATEAMRFANRKLKEYKDQAHKPTILVLPILSTSRFRNYLSTKLHHADHANGSR